MSFFVSQSILEGHLKLQELQNNIKPSQLENNEVCVFNM